MADFDTLADVASGHFAAEEGDHGLWYINHYFPDAEGTTRRSTLFDGLTKPQAKDLEERLNKYAGALHTAMRKYKRYAYK